MQQSKEPDPTTVIDRHITAFNDRDLDALMAGFTDDAVWITGTSVVCGHAEVA